MRKTIAMLLTLTAATVTLGQAQTSWKMQPVVMQTRWAKEVSPSNALKEYPRPQMARTGWINLNGLWDYAITPKDAVKPSAFEGQILVPYPLESALSGVKKALLPSQNLWYKRNFTLTDKSSERTLLHFGAIDWQATVFVNGKEVGNHVGGYTEFSFDITGALKAGVNELMVKVYDPTDQGIGPHGKQVLNPQSIYYTPTSGIWQTVWMENVPLASITGLTIVPNIDKSQVDITVSSMTKVPIQLVVEGKTINGLSNSVIAVSIKNMKLWSPASPYLYDFTAKLGTDVVKSYFGMRKISVAKDSKGVDRIMLNNKPYYNLGILDQGFWPDGLYTAPTDEALAFDIKAIKAMGFNTIRKHIKVEPARWYYHADKLGMLVWQDMVNPNQGLPAGSKPEFEKESKEIMDQFHNFPSITTWVVFNEEWGAYDQAKITSWVKQSDPNRIVNGHSGGFLYVNDQKAKGVDTVYVNSDITDIHSYPNPVMSLKQEGKAQVCGEFGGIGVSVPGHEWNDMQGWGYVQATPKELIAKYTVMIKRLTQLKEAGLSGSIYTQPFDVEGEENGLMTYDREIIKIPINTIRDINQELTQYSTPIQTDFTIAKDIDQNDTDDRYQEVLNAFENSKVDSANLRRLTLMAIRKKDQNNATKVGNAYLAQLKEPYTTKNLLFISHITRTSKDNGFQIFLKDSIKVNRILGENEAQKIARSIIGQEEVTPYITGANATPDWKAIENNVAAKYGQLGLEKVFGAEMIYYYDRQDWNNFGRYYALYYATAYSRSEFHINNVSWPIVENVSDHAVLKIAVQTMKYDIEKYDANIPEVLDTYANLLYKLGRKKEALEVEQKAVNLSNGNIDIIENMKKMQKGQKTWIK